LICLFPPLGILQNNTAPMVIDNPPLLDLLQRAKAAETGQVIVKAAVSHARRLNGAVGITHLRRTLLREFRNLITQGKGNPGIHHKDSGWWAQETNGSG
jgi:hypothetical protein